MAILEISDLHKSFGTQAVLEGVNLSVEEGQITTLIGKSGSGKTVLLKCIASLLRPDQGDVRVEGESILSDRALGGLLISYLFQGNALFDSLTSRENVGLPLREGTSLSPAMIEDKVNRLFDQLDLNDMGHKYPGELSGGMQRRVALARALVTEPKIVLFDEPTAGLDPVRRNAVLDLIRRDSTTFGFTAIVVSHDVPESLLVTDQAAMLENGGIVAAGAPWELMALAEQHPTLREFLDNEESLLRLAVGMRSGKELAQCFAESQKDSDTAALIQFAGHHVERDLDSILRLPQLVRIVREDLRLIGDPVSELFSTGPGLEAMMFFKSIPAQILESAVHGIPSLESSTPEAAEFEIRLIPLNKVLSLTELLNQLRQREPQSFTYSPRTLSISPTR